MKERLNLSNRNTSNHRLVGKLSKIVGELFKIVGKLPKNSVEVAQKGKKNYNKK